MKASKENRQSLLGLEHPYEAVPSSGKEPRQLCLYSGSKEAQVGVSQESKHSGLHMLAVPRWGCLDADLVADKLQQSGGPELMHQVCARERIKGTVPECGWYKFMQKSKETAEGCAHHKLEF